MIHDSNIMQWVAECLRGCFWVRFRDHTIIHEIRATTRRMKRARLARVVKFEIRTSFLLQMLDYYIGSQHRFPFVFIFFFSIYQISFQLCDRIAYASANIESRVRLLKYWADQIKIRLCTLRPSAIFTICVRYSLWTVKYLVIATVPQHEHKKCSGKTKASLMPKVSYSISGEPHHADRKSNSRGEIYSPISLNRLIAICYTRYLRSSPSRSRYSRTH